MKNPKWQRDELILALDLYFRKSYNILNVKHLEVIKLSKILNLLPIYEQIDRTSTFRNAKGVYMKLGNFLHIDPNDKRNGLPSHSKLDKQIWDEFNENKDLLRNLAQSIIDITEDKELNSKLYLMTQDEEETFEVKEGLVLYKLHKIRERKKSIINKKKEKVLKETGKLECEICGFDFNKFYGILGKGFIECHHCIPLNQMNSNYKTRLEDLILLCSNCHRVVHRNIDKVTIEELKIIIKQQNHIF